MAGGSPIQDSKITPPPPRKKFTPSPKSDLHPPPLIFQKRKFCYAEFLTLRIFSKKIRLRRPLRGSCLPYYYISKKLFELSIPNMDICLSIYLKSAMANLLIIFSQQTISWFRVCCNYNMKYNMKYSML